MNALRAGKLNAPIDGALGEALAPAMPTKPAPAPSRLSYQHEARRGGD
jgi:hypothetical protein